MSMCRSVFRKPMRTASGVLFRVVSVAEENAANVRLEVAIPMLSDGAPVEQQLGFLPDGGDMMANVQHIAVRLGGQLRQLIAESLDERRFANDEVLDPPRIIGMLVEQGLAQGLKNSHADAQ